MIGAGIIIIGITLAVVGWYPTSDSGFDQYGNHWTGGGYVSGIAGLAGLVLIPIGIVILGFGFMEERKLAKG